MRRILIKNTVILRPLASEKEKSLFIKEIQEAFQTSYETEFGPFEKTILPEKDIQESLEASGAETNIAELDGARIGGAIITVDREEKRHSLDLLYVSPLAQNSGNGLKIWKAIESLHPETRVWETHAPYFDKRNIHFYINRCGFKIVEFFNPKHKDPHQGDGAVGNIPEENNYFFDLKKKCFCRKPLTRQLE